MSTYESYYSQFERGFFANSTLGVLVQSCVGGIAAMAVLANGNSLLQMFQLIIVVALSFGYNGAILSQQKPRTVFNILLASLVFNAILAILNFVR